MSGEKYRWWEILDEMQEGWVIDNTAGSPLSDCVFITNGKSVLRGQKRALLRRVRREEKKTEQKTMSFHYESNEDEK